MQKLPSLNGLRAISIIIVILYHLIRFSINVNPNIFLRFPIFDGQFGVNIFFVISGFLITSLLLTEEENTGTISIRNFYTRRTLRIFPAYLFLLLIYWCLQLTGYIHIPRMAWLTALTYTKYFNYRIDWYTAHAWSLSIEETFYLFWPITFLLGNKVRKNVAISLVFMVLVVRSYIYYYPVPWINEQSLFTRIDSIAIGCLFALYRNVILKLLSPYWSKLFYMSLFLLFFLPWVATWLGENRIVLLFIPFGVLHGSLADVLIGVILMYSVYGPKNNWYQMLNSKILNYVGILSYSLYLWQQIFFSDKSWWVIHPPQNVICIFLAAQFSYYLIEKPFLKLKSRFSNKSPARHILQAPTVMLILDEKESI